MARRAPAVVLLLGLFAVVAMVAPRPALACDCPEPPPPREAREQVDAVFSGEVVAVTRPGPDVDPPDRELVAEIEVAEVYAGEVHERVEVRTAGDQAMCGYGFESGRAELVYATSDDGSLSTSLCDRTRALDRAGEDLAELGAGEPPLAGPGPGIAATPQQPVVGWRLGLVGGFAVVVLVLGVWRARARRRA